jgi:hypothetical protein
VQIVEPRDQDWGRMFLRICPYFSVQCAGHLGFSLAA